MLGDLIDGRGKSWSRVWNPSRTRRLPAVVPRRCKRFHYRYLRSAQ
jgi:hypothetical protein